MLAADPWQALATPRRREILRLVWQQERSAGEIHLTMADVTFGAVSQHLRCLRDAGLVQVRAAGRQRMYVAIPRAVAPLIPVLTAMWDDALYALKIQAEMAHARRGPAPQARHRPRPPGRTQR